MKFTHVDGEQVTVYEGFQPFRASLMEKTMFLAIAVIEGEHDLWCCEDEMGFRELQRYYQEHHDIQPDIVSAKPLALHSGCWTVQAF